MIESSFNILDLIVLIVIGLSAMLSFFRGFLREVMSLGTWIAASIIALYLFPTASKLIEPHVKSAVIASGLASIGVFFIALISISIASGLLLKFIKPSKDVGILDNLIGLCFGVARGVLIVAIAYFIATIVIVEKDMPDWVQEAKSRPYIAKAAKAVAKLTPSYLDAITAKGKHAAADDKKSGEKKFDDVLKKLDASHDKKSDASDDASPSAALPSMEDLQQRIREENEKK
jgi:membrane protein required for colicin V production